ncbi:SulP family inorganic anion transporter [Streptomyces sp. NBC_01431]|uniref:SulP family inorganic anion transporter n=1 Tax=Streptomyces sp. NBC_01431 TaxID=2903863 RepID=UPI002E34120A|nr:SulP family inorganic anion transporter [Streptomyces sp. NBC_01431]
MKTAGSRAGRLRGWLGRPARADVSAGAITALFSVPEGMAYAAIAGFNPVAGLYAGAVPAVVGSVFARTALMVTTLTSAIALTSRSALLASGLDPMDPANVAALTVAVGVCMALFALLRLGSLLRLVSTAAMTGFSVGIAVQIIAGAVDDATEYRSGHHNRLTHLLDWAANIGMWSASATAASAAAVVVWALAHRHPRLRSLAVLLALVAATAAVTGWGAPVALASSLGPIPAGLPGLSLPAWSALPRLVPGACAVAVVALAQAAGIPRSLPASHVPPGMPVSAGGDICAQAAANVAGAFFQALPAGGSLSRTGVAQAAGARTRWAGIISGVLLALLVATAGPLAGYIPLPVIGALVAVIGCKLVVARWAEIRSVLASGPGPAAVILLTFLATTQAPLQYALAVGLVASLTERLIHPVRERCRMLLATFSRP